MLSLEIEGSIVDDLENLSLVVTLAQVPELLQQFHGQETFTGQNLKDLVGPLHKLKMRPLRVPEDVKDLLLLHPLDKLLHREDLRAVELVVANDRVELLDTEDTSLQEGRGEALCRHLKLHNLSLLFDLFTVHNACIDRINRNLYLVDVVLGD